MIKIRCALDLFGSTLVKKESAVHSILTDLLRGGDMVLTQGAGSVGLLAKELAGKGFHTK